MQNDGFIMDDVYSQDPNDPDDKLKVKRSKSNERMPKLRSKLLENKQPDLQRGRSSSPPTKGGYKSLLKPQKKF